MTARTTLRASVSVTGQFPVPASPRGRWRNASTCSSRSLAIRLTCDLEGRRSKLLVRIDGAGASHDTIDHLEQLSTTRRRRRVARTIGWTITELEETTI